MRTIVAAVPILSACFMQEVSGDAELSSAPVDATALKPDEVNSEMIEETEADGVEETEADGETEVEETEDDAGDEDVTDDVADDSEELADADDTDEVADDSEELADADEDEEVDGELSLLERVSLLEGNAAEYEDDEDEDGEVDVIDDMYEENPVVTLTAAMSEAVQTLSKKSEDLLVEAQKYEATDTAKTAAEQAMKEFQDAYDKELKTKGSTWEAEVLAKAKQASLIQTNTTDDEVDDEEEVGEEGDAVDEDDEEEEVADDDDDSEEDELDPIDDMDEENAVVTLVAAMSENVQTLSKKSEDLLVEAQKYNSTETAQNAAEQALKEFQAAFDLELKEKGTKWEDEVFAKAEQAKNPVKASPPAADAAEASPPAADAATDHAKTPA